VVSKDKDNFAQILRYDFPDQVGYGGFMVFNATIFQLYRGGKL
jgi:hypothetical protein